MEKNYIEITYLNNTVKLIKYISESDNLFEKKLNYIKDLEKKNIKWSDALKKTNIWYYNKFFKCNYS